jgi:hypothetical protein
VVPLQWSKVAKGRSLLSISYFPGVPSSLDRYSCRALSMMKNRPRRCGNLSWIVFVFRMYLHRLDGMNLRLRIECIYRNPRTGYTFLYSHQNQNQFHSHAALCLGVCLIPSLVEDEYLNFNDCKQSKLNLEVARWLHLNHVFSRARDDCGCEKLIFSGGEDEAAKIPRGLSA